MFCSRCGRKIEDGAAVCSGCGAPASGVPQSGPARPLEGPEAAPAGGEPASGKRRGWILPTVIGIAAAACVLAAVLLSGAFSDAKGTLARALVKSVNAWQAAADSLELPELPGLEREAGLDMTVRLRRLSDRFGRQAQLLEGMSLSFSGDLDLPERKMEVGLGVSYGSAELLRAGMAGNDGVLSLSCPALLGEQAFGVNTETLGQTLYRLDPAAMEAVQNAGFNIFDLLEAAAAPAEVDAGAVRALYDAISVEKAGKAEVDAGGKSVRGERYRVTIPQEAMLDCLDAVKAAYAARKWNGELLKVMGSFGATEEELEVMREQLEGRKSLEALTETLEETGDVTLEALVSDGYISCVRWEGEEESLTARFGGGERYADDLSLDVQAGEIHFRLASSGNHSAAAGAFTDTTALLAEVGGSAFSLESQLTYDPRLPSDNFSWTVSGEGVSLTARGQLTCGDRELFLDLEDAGISFPGEEYVGLGISWRLRPCAGLSPAAPVMLEDMTEADLETLYAGTVANTRSWLWGLMGQAPELFRLFL